MKEKTIFEALELMSRSIYSGDIDLFISVASKHTCTLLCRQIGRCKNVKRKSFYMSALDVSLQNVYGLNLSILGSCQ